MEEQLRLPLNTAIEALENLRYRYAIIGGLAVSIWGIARNTLDIDIKVLVNNLEYQRIRGELISIFPNSARENAPKNNLILSVKINEVIVDFLFTVPGYDELIVERAIEQSIDDLTVWMCSAEDLVIQKMVAGRGRDYFDVQTILDVQKGKLDYQYIVNWLAQFADLLEKPEILSDYLEMKTKSSSTKSF